MMEILQTILLALAWLLCIGAPLALGGLLVCWLLNMPLRRQENARFLLDLVAVGLRNGIGVEKTLTALSQTGDRDLGGRFHLVASFLQTGSPLIEAIERAPRLLPARITALLRIGAKLGDLSRIMPVARTMLNDGSAGARKAKDYFITLAFIVTPATILAVVFVQLMVIPKYEEILLDMVSEEGYNAVWFAFMRFNWIWVAAQLLLLTLIWSCIVVYFVNPVASAWEGSRLAEWISAIQYAVPWKRKRMQRDFAAALGLLLDSGMPEDQAVSLAAQCAENLKFIRLSRQCVERLQSGVKLTEAILPLDSSRQLEWRLRNTGNSDMQAQRALAGWREELDAKAFQQEQTFTQAFTSGLAVWNGVVVGVIAIAVFINFARMIDHASPW